MQKWLVGAIPCTWNFGSNWPPWSESAAFRSLFARSDSAITPSEKVQLTLIGSPLRVCQWAHDEHRTLSLSPQKGGGAQKTHFAFFSTEFDRFSGQLYHSGCCLPVPVLHFWPKLQRTMHRGLLAIAEHLVETKTSGLWIPENIMRRHILFYVPSHRRVARGCTWCTCTPMAKKNWGPNW